MSLSILCVTNNQHQDVARHILRMHNLAVFVGAEFVLGLDRVGAKDAEFYRETANKTLELCADKLQEDVLDQAVAACSGDWVLRLDDDELVSEALEVWLSKKRYETGNLFAFPRIYLYPDDQHYLTNPGMYPDLQTRLGRKSLMFGVNYVHAGNPNGTGTVIPYAIEHHNLLVKTRAEREAILARYESLRPGAGTVSHYARYNVPELFYQELASKEYTNHGDFSAR